MIDLFKALSEESRLRILSLLLDDEMCVCEIEASLKTTQSNASRHLTVLKKCGILESYKKAQWAYYRVSDKFKMENKLLWDYLQQRLIELPSYNADRNESQCYKEKDLCTNRNN